jgi:hypothetical protein
MTNRKSNKFPSREISDFNVVCDGVHDVRDRQQDISSRQQRAPHPERAVCHNRMVRLAHQRQINA